MGWLVFRVRQVDAKGREWFVCAQVIMMSGGGAPLLTLETTGLALAVPGSERWEDLLIAPSLILPPPSDIPEYYPGTLGVYPPVSVRIFSKYI